MLWGEAFDLPWNIETNDGNTGSASAALDPSTRFRSFPSMNLSLAAGMLPGSSAGVSNRGLGNEGLSLQAGNPYEGVLLLAASQAGNNRTTGTVTVIVSLRDFTSSALLASTTLSVPIGAPFQPYNFTLVPAASTACSGIAPGSDPSIDCGNFNELPGSHICVRCGGEFVVSIAQTPAQGFHAQQVSVGYALLQPGEWGRFAGLPVRADTVAVLQQMGITMIRLGGTFAQDIRWKEWRGPAPWARDSLGHSWGASRSFGGWGIFEAADMTNAMGNVELVVSLAWEQSAEDWADLVEYCWGNSSTAWGALRITDGHPEPYRISWFEIGNEEYNNDIVVQMMAMQERANAVGVPAKLHFVFPDSYGISTQDAARIVAAAPLLDPTMFMPDMHVAAGGGVEFAQQTLGLLPNFPQTAVNFETNANISTHLRAVQEAADLNDWFTTDGSFSSRLLARTASFCTERSGHFDNFDQGLVFFLPNMTWMQPPAWVHVMVNQSWAPNAAALTTNSSSHALPDANIRAFLKTVNGLPASAKGLSHMLQDQPLSFSAQVSDDKSMVVVRVTNLSPNPLPVLLQIKGITVKPVVQVSALTHADPSAVNTPSSPDLITPSTTSQTLNAGDSYSVPGFSYVQFVYTAA
jgi:hypothetical protein